MRLECTDCGLVWIPQHTEEAACPRCAPRETTVLEAEREMAKAAGDEARAEVSRLSARVTELESAAAVLVDDYVGVAQIADARDSVTAGLLAASQAEVSRLTAEVDVSKDRYRIVSGALVDAECAVLRLGGERDGTLGRTLYRDNVCVGMVDSRDIAEAIAAVMNALGVTVPTPSEPPAGSTRGVPEARCEHFCDVETCEDRCSKPPHPRVDGRFPHRCAVHLAADQSAVAGVPEGKPCGCTSPRADECGSPGGGMFCPCATCHTS